MSFGIHQIRAIVRASQSDGGAIQQKLTDERDALVTELIENPEAGKEIISGSGNGVSMNASITITKTDRLAWLDRCLYYVENGVWPSSTSYARFGGGGGGGTLI